MFSEFHESAANEIEEGTSKNRATFSKLIFSFSTYMLFTTNSIGEADMV